MTKKGPLAKAETFYVKEHCKTQSTEQIAKDLDRPISTVRKAVDKFKVQHGDQPLTSAGAQMARREGIVTMTENASSVSDQSKKRSGPTRSDTCVTRIKKDG